ncbi:MAG: hypothetical protein JJT75_07120, partial [Opitutales bacterium]|nr:hypothetical protein [Opitutales bacterium]
MDGSPKNGISFGLTGMGMNGIAFRQENRFAFPYVEPAKSRRAAGEGTGWQIGGNDIGNRIRRQPKGSGHVSLIFPRS